MMDKRPTKPPRRPGLRSAGWWAFVGLAVVVAYTASQRTVVLPSAWGRDLPSAQRRASIEDQCVLIEFTLPGCGYCRQMESEVLTHSDVVRVLGDWIPVQLDMSQDMDSAERYRITGAPTFIALSPQGADLGRIVGYQPVDHFLRFLDRACPSGPTIPPIAEQPGPPL